MNRRIAKGAAVLIAAGLAFVGVASATHTFDDVPDGRFYSDPVAWAAANGITTGTSATTFEPDRNVTRGESVTFLKRYHDTFVEPITPVDPVPSIYFAAVNGGGTLIRGTEGVTAGPDAVYGTGYFNVDFGRDVTECSHSASAAEADPVEPTTTIFVPEVIVSAMPRPAEPNVLIVHTGDGDSSTLTSVGADFHIQVFCWD
jgi:hypothetical protein